MKLNDVLEYNFETESGFCKVAALAADTSGNQGWAGLTVGGIGEDGHCSFTPAQLRAFAGKLATIADELEALNEAHR